MTDAIRDIQYPETPDDTPGRQRDVSLSAVIRQNDALQRELQLQRVILEKVVQNQEWVNGMVQMAMQALQSMPGVGAMMAKMMGPK